MFNIAFPEFIVIAIVALVVIGPDKLPKVARGAGLLIGRLQRFTSDLKAEMNGQLKLDDLNKLHEELRQKELGLNEELRQGMLPVASVLKSPVTPQHELSTEAANDLAEPTVEHQAAGDNTGSERSGTK